MWIYTPTGFISAVAKRSNPTNLTVRARDRRSLDGLVELSGATATIGEGTDYPYRVVVTRELFKHWMSTQIDDLSYSNFKTEAERVSGYEYASVLGMIWHDSLTLEDQESAQHYFDLSNSHKATN
jgi:hypothetical protein